MPRTAAGLIRSKEMMPKEPRAAKPMLHHLEVHPMMGGGVHVHHVMHSPGAPYPMNEASTKVHKFKAHQGEEFADHMMKHSGMSWDPEEEGEKEANAGAENEVENGDELKQA